MTAETSNAREWVLVPRELLDEARNIAMEWTVRGRVHECGKFGQIAQDLDAMLNAAPPPPPADAEVWLFKGTDGAWHTFHNEQHRLDTIADGRWEVRKFTALSQQPAATAAKDAEIEALRAQLDEQCRLHAIGMERELALITERDRLRAEVERSERYAEQSERERLWTEARAERLAEALREAADDLERGIDARIVVAQLRAAQHPTAAQEDGQ